MKIASNKFCLALIGLAAGLATVGASWAAGTKATVTAHDVYLRSFAGSYPVGSLNQGQIFDVQSSHGDYHWGYAHGKFNGCAWISGGNVNRSGAGTGPKCPAAPTSGGPDTLIKLRFATTNPYPTGGGGDAVMPSKFVSCSTTGMYGNYRGGAHLDKFLTVSKNQRVFWRYTSVDKQSAMVMNNDNPNRKWGFVPTRCLADHLVK